MGIRQSEAIGLRWQFVDLGAGTIEVGWQLKRARYRHGCQDAAACAATRHRVACPKRCTNHSHQDDCLAGCTKREHRCPQVKRPCPVGCIGHSRECPHRTGGGWHFTRRKGVKAGQGKAKLVLALPAPLIAQLRAHRRQQAAERLTAGAAWQDWDLVFCTPAGAPIDSRDDWADWRSLIDEAGRADVSAAVAEFSGRSPMVADLLAEELLHRAPKDLSEFLLRTSVADVLDAELCDALSGRTDSGEVLRRMEADLKFVMATGPGRDTWRYHPLLAEMLRSELQTHRPDEVQRLNRLTAGILQPRGDIAGAVRCLLAAGDTDRAFSLCSRLRTTVPMCPISRVSRRSSTCSRGSW